MKNVILEITPQNCYPLFNEFGLKSVDSNLLKTRPQDILFVIFTGGEDVHPSLYNENVGKYTRCNWNRDEYESEMFDLAMKHNIPCVGICRGSQFLCVKSGGKLCQHIENHSVSRHHKIKTHDNQIIECNSFHHQMQLPPDDAVILATAEPRLSKVYLNGDDEFFVPEHEYEAAYYPNTNSLGIQWHPEWLGYNHPGSIYTRKLVREFIVGERYGKFKTGNERRRELV